jgi:putative solute:sodium symporter small subunit
MRTPFDDEASAGAARPAGGRLSDQVAKAYWQANLRLVAVLLTVWFTVSFGFGILLVDWLNEFELFGFKLGFWWAQQGSIFVFVILIFVYSAVMKRIDHRFGVDDDDPRSR